jgi:hypothetical protein
MLFWDTTLLAYFPKMKVGSSNHVCLSVCPPPITSELYGIHEIWFGGNDIQWDLDAMIFNAMASVTLKLLRFKVVR